MSIMPIHPDQDRGFNPETAAFLEDIYRRCNVAARLAADPLAVVKRYGSVPDQELAGLVCSILAFGSVGLIMRACERALEPLGNNPAQSLDGMSVRDIRALWADFQYRFCFPKDMAGILCAARRARREHGSLEALFLACGGSRPEGFLKALSLFVGRLREWSAEASEGGIRPNLLPDPAEGSACKRLFLYLRWMVRKDEIDLGAWSGLSPSSLIVPLDTHMAATCRERLGFLPSRSRKAMPALRDALEVTRRFAVYSPDDPVRYDFALTRPGIDPRPGDEVFGCR